MSFIVYHPDTGTIVEAERAIIVNTRSLPADPEEWEEYLRISEVPWIAVQHLIEDRIFFGLNPMSCNDSYFEEE